MIADDEPKYLRRQKPVEIKRRKFGRKAWSTYLRVAMWTAAGIAGAAGAYAAGNFLLTSPEMALIHPDQISVSGNRVITPENVREVFVADRGKSILRVPIAKRRLQLEAIPWVEHATVRRALPNRIEVEVTERTPVAFLRDGNEMALVDAQGVILDRPVSGEFHFPVVKGISSETPIDERAQRMELYSKFLQEIESDRAGAAEQVSEVDLFEPRDLRASITGLDGDSAPVLVHFGEGDFAGKYQTLVDQFALWRAKAGRIESVDLRFSREAVVNQDTSAVALETPKKAANALLH